LHACFDVCPMLRQRAQQQTAHGCMWVIILT
jgi:hypothetical protein